MPAFTKWGLVYHAIDLCSAMYITYTCNFFLMFPKMHPFTFIVHCCVLLNHIPPTHCACAPFSSIPETVQVPWEAWGVAATHWFEGNPTSALDNNDSRPVCCHDGGEVSGPLQQQQCNWNKVPPNGNQMVLKVENSMLNVGSVFKDDIC